MNEALIADPVRSRQILERIPAQRWGTPADFEGAVVFLASKASDYVSGECLVVDGGWMGRKSGLHTCRAPPGLCCLPDVADKSQDRCDALCAFVYRSYWMVHACIL